MDTSQLKTYAPEAHRAFIAAVTAQAARIGIKAGGSTPAEIIGDVLLINGQAFPVSYAKPRKRLVERIQAHGFDRTMEAIAYTWFNRFVAIRYMELHGYLDHGYRVLSARGDRGEGLGARPEILDHAADVDLPGLDPDRVVELKLDGTKDEELYQMLLKAQCNALNQAMPFLFEKIGDETELLLPANLLHSDSLIRQLVESIDESAWEQIEIIGWLYQFYISEKKDQVIGKVVASVDIPAATQLFTPNWIVKFLVQNSLGAQWLATYPQSPLKGQMAYYIEPTEQTDEVKAQLAAITPSQLNPEELTLIDPACGSGHILVEAYELFKAIYLERGYRQRDVAKLILEKNLFGLDIDERAAQLTGFALMMKGRADDRRLFERGVKLNVMALVDSGGVASGEWLVISEQLEQLAPNHSSLATEINELVDLFEHATTFGSLIQVPEGLASSLPALKQLSEATSQDLFVSEALKRLRPLVQQAELLAARYDAVVANPPYMGNKGMNAAVKKLAKDSFPDAKSDLFACFIERGLTLAKEAGHNALVTMQSWMFLSSYEKMRERLLARKTVRTMAHLGARAFGSISGEVVQTTSFVLCNAALKRYKPTFFRLLDGGEQEKQSALTNNRSRFDSTPQSEFRKIPGSPVAYWLSNRFRRLFEEGTLLGQLVDARQGMATADNDQFLRRWQEVNQETSVYDSENRNAAAESGKRWFPYNKGGEFRKWFGNHDYVVNWASDGRDLFAFRPRSVIRSPEYYFQESLTWSDVTSGPASFRLNSSGGIHDVAGMSAFSFHGVDRSLLAGYCNTPIVLAIARATNPTLHFQIGDFVNVPFLEGARARLSRDVIRNVQWLVASAQIDWNAYERSWNFHSLPLLTAASEPTPTLESSYIAWITQNRDTIAEMKRLEEENNRLFIDAYGLADELTPDVPIEQITLTVNPAYRYGKKVASGQWSVASGFGEELEARFRGDTMEEVVSYAVGCMMGRYRLDRPGLIYAHAGNKAFWNIYEGEQDILATSHYPLTTIQDGEELQGPDRLAKGDDTGGVGLSGHSDLSKRGDLRTDQSITQGSGVDPLQHSGGTSTPIDDGIQALPLDSPGLTGRGRDATAHRKPPEVLDYRSTQPSHGNPHGGEQNASSRYEQTQLNVVTSGQWPVTSEEKILATSHSSLATIFHPDDDGIVPLTDTEWFDDDAAHRLIEFMSVAWDKSHLEANLTFLADNLSPKKNESSRETLRRYLCDSFFKDHLQTYKKRPIYWLFSSGKQKAFQCLVYLHRYNEGTLSRMRSEYVIPLQGKMAARIEKLKGDIQAATSSAHRRQLEKERAKLEKQEVELRAFDEKLRHYADRRITLDLDDGVKVNYGKFGVLLAEVKAVHGKEPEDV